MLDYNSIAELIQAAEKENITISELVVRDQAEQTETPREKLIAHMRDNLHVMQQAVAEGTAQDLKSTSGLTGGDAYKMQQYSKTGGLCGSFFGNALTRALAVSEYNAAMGKIVAAPTAGSCGILPGTILSLLEERELPEDIAVMALFTAGAFGMVIATKASIAGAQGGCQAECGSASAMAAAALVEMAGGTPEMCGHACAIAIKNQLGLVCDPIAGLVEVPCVKRNAGGVACAFTAAELALAGIKSVIPVDEVIDAMREVGDAMPCALKETALGGLAATPTGMRLKQEIFGE
ncbi:MAG: L-serine ammonia-lyase, iron-sulfur-dependent, subunit alpha [Butyricicoccus pullicaecorum]|nr:L-serine ammonia-lyase, iron-sulfur-dependent, subunit alpha [Butyricicoccus pullicaecorum]MDO4668984.1 L-serine ammonia-lyase, iron-sulfur-dependent, subunit alpha [Butyricicoccus pullicaecorum]